MENDMFCYQCEQTAGGKGCVKFGVCEKSPEVSNLQDLLIHQLKGIGFYGEKCLEKGEKIPSKINKFIADTMFSTLTNVNFDPERFVEYNIKANKFKRKLMRMAGDISNAPNNADYLAPENKRGMLLASENIGIMANEDLDMDIRSLRELLIYGLKGMAAYAHHSYVLNKFDDKVNGFFYKGLSATLNDSLTVDDLFNLNMKLGEVNLRCMEMLNKAHTDAYGHPTPTEVSITKKKGPFIIVSGHDLKDLHELLKQTEGKGINIYTHGEMLPAHGYPELNKFDHLVGNFGGAWQDQQKEFDNIPGAILMTTNCLMKPRESYSDRLFTTSIVGFPNTPYISEENEKKDFSEVINKALELGGFPDDEKDKKITVGFGHKAVLSHAEKIVDSVKKGNIKHFFVIGGCDGARSGRNYYTEFAEKTPKDTIILTLACGKYRFNKLKFGTVEGLPRLLDVGQCNDTYNAIVIAKALSEAFDCDINELPLSLVLSWYEQKAVAILLTLLHLDIKNIYLGPTLPAFVTPNILQVLTDKFKLTPISTADKDLEAILG
ncbi:MAG: hydroxylamine reductase [Firmicutes bacterium]|nr:hydroxylamine reductase [Bacillota bacterium]